MDNGLKGWAIALRAPSPPASGALRSPAFGRVSTIAAALPDRLTLIICAAICIAADIAIWRTL